VDKGIINEKSFAPSQASKGLVREIPDSVYKIGENQQYELDRSDKINYEDPIMELQHIIGYSPSTCPTVKWSRIPEERAMIFASGGCLIAMDFEK